MTYNFPARQAHKYNENQLTPVIQYFSIQPLLPLRLRRQPCRKNSAGVRLRTHSEKQRITILEEAFCL
jgi:hypothetical protein